MKRFVSKLDRIVPPLSSCTLVTMSHHAFPAQDTSFC